MTETNLISFINVFSENFENKGISKCTVSLVKKNNTENIEYSKVFIKSVVIKNTKMLSFVFRYPTKDITKNFNLEETKNWFNDSLGKIFLQVDLYCEDLSYHLLYSKSGESKFSKRN